jgi:hypothetical protein
MIKDGIVINVVEWDGSTPYALSDQLVSLADHPEVGIGWSYDGSTFAEPVEE